MIAIGIVYAPAFARVIRGSVFASWPSRISSRRAWWGPRTFGSCCAHVLPNILAPFIVMATVYLSAAILSEAALSFLGLGTQPPEPSWGGMLKRRAASWSCRRGWRSSRRRDHDRRPGFNFLGDGLRDILDPRLMPRGGATQVS